MPTHLPPLIVAAWGRHARAQPAALVADFLEHIFEADEADLDVAALPPQTRSGLVLAILTQRFGTPFDLRVECASCDEAMEMSLPLEQALTADDGDGSPTSWAAPERLTLSPTCPSCGHAQDLDLDPMELLAHTLHAEAHRLTAEVAALGRAFGWPPAVTLGLSEAERDRYLELAGAG